MIYVPFKSGYHPYAENSEQDFNDNMRDQLKILISALLAGSATIGYANTLEYELRGCDHDFCDTVIGEGTFGIDDISMLEGKGRGSGLAGGIARGAGVAIDVAVGAVESMRGAAVAAGYHQFEGTLSGPSGKVQFGMDLRTGAWTFSASGGPDFKRIPAKSLQPTDAD